MVSARHVIERIVYPCFLSLMASYDVVSTVHQSLGSGGVSGTHQSRHSVA